MVRRKGKVEGRRRKGEMEREGEGKWGRRGEAEIDGSGRNEKGYYYGRRLLSHWEGMRGEKGRGEMLRGERERLAPPPPASTM